MEAIEQKDHIQSQESSKEAVTYMSLDAKTEHVVDGGIENKREHARAGPESENDSPSQEQWNTPRINIYRYFATIYSFIIMGMNDAAYGVSSPSTLPSFYPE
jgi:hypothetical protein